MASLRETRARDEQAARLRAIGYTWQAVADHLRYRSRQAAHIAVTRHYDRTRETPEFARRSLTEGLRLVQQQLFEELADATKRGDVQAITATSREIRLATREMANLDGLHAPKQVEVQVTHFRSATEILADARRELSAAIDAEVVDVEPRAIEQ